MAKLMEESLGTFGNIFLALTFLGVMYLVLKQSKIKLNISQNNSSVEGLPHSLRYNATVHDQYRPHESYHR